MMFLFALCFKVRHIPKKPTRSVECPFSSKKDMVGMTGTYCLHLLDCRHVRERARGKMGGMALLPSW